MAIALSGSLILSGSITVSGSIISTGTISMSGSIASASYATNADLLDGLDSTVFTLTSSFIAQTASFTAFTASILTQTASLNSFSSSVLTFTGSATTRLGALESYTSSLNNKTSSFATTGSNTFVGNQVVSGSFTTSGSITSTSTITAQTLVVQTITSSVVYSSGSNIFGNALNNSQTFTGSVLVTGSLTIAGASSATSYNGATIFGSTIACSPIGCFATSCATSFIGGTLSGTTIYGSTAVCSAVGLFSGCVGVGTVSPLSLLDVRSGYITAGTAASTNGTIIMQGYYSNGAITTFGTMYSSGGPVIGYGVTPSTSADNAFLSSTGITVSRGAYYMQGGSHIWYSGGSQTCSIGTAVSMTELMRISSGGVVTVGTNFQIDAAGDFYQKTTGAGQVSAAIANTTYPTYGFYGNTGVGMYRAAADTLAFTTSATKRLTITSAGIVQIGSTAGSSGMFLTTGDAGITCNNTYFGTGQVRIGGGSDAGANTVLSIAPGVVAVDAPGVSGGRFKLSEAGTLGINCTGVAARTMVVKGATGCYIVAEFIEPAGVHSMFLYPNKNCTNHISSDYMSGGVYLPLSLSGRECTTDLVLGTNGRVGIGSGANNGILTVYESGCTVSLGISCFCNQAKGIEIYNANSGTTNNVVGLWISTGPHKVGIASGRTCAETTWEVDLRFYTHPTTIGTLDGTCENMRLYGDGSLVTRAGASSPGLYSDINLKENLSIIPSALNKIQCINGYTFDWKDTAPSRRNPSLLNIIHDAGLIAQEVENILPDIVRNNDLSCTKMLNYNGITALLVEGMKEQQCTICSQASIINTLKTCLGII